MRGGKREGAGRKPGSTNKMANEARQRAHSGGELPHEFLLRAARGVPIDGEVLTLDKRLEAAKAAAPYYAPRLATQTVQGPGGGPVLIGGVETTDTKLIDAEIRALLAEKPDLATYFSSKDRS